MVFKKLIKHNIAWFLSLSFHFLLFLEVISLNDDLKKVKNDHAITVNIISSFKQEVSDEEINKKQVKISKELKKIKKRKETIKQDENLNNESDKKEKIIKDLSYSQETYQIGSKKNPLPPYPRIAKLRNYQGEIEVSVVTDFQGNVVNAEIHHSSGYSILDNAALRTLKKWRFNVQNLLTDAANKKQQYRIIVPINFVLK